VADAGTGKFDFGWGGAAGAFLAIDTVNDITLYYAQHVVLSPVQPLRGKIYTIALEEITGKSVQEIAADYAAMSKLTY
jgi:hypothetical protein